jgi:hypothetical protein
MIDAEKVGDAAKKNDMKRKCRFDAGLGGEK